MNSSLPTGNGCRSSFQLHFQPLVDTRPAYVFPCDGAGQVDLDALGARSLNDYLYARAVVGCEFARPKVIACAA